MLLEWFPSLKENKIVNLINKFLYSKYYILLIGLGTLLCNLFSFEMYWFYFIVTLGVILPALLCDDFLPIVAPLGMTYSSISMKANSIKYKTTIFGGSHFVHLFVLIGLITVALLPRLIYDIVKKPERRVKPALLWGFAILGPAYLLGGLCSSYYQTNTVIYGLVNFLSISGCYFILLYAINWKNVKKDYFFYLMLAYGLAIACEVFYMFAITKTGSDAFTSYLGHMYTGWGMRNNIASQICLCVAAPLYLAIKNKKFDILFLAAGLVMILGCVLTNSRGGTLASILFYLIGLVVLFIRGDKYQRIRAAVVVGVALVGVSVFFIIKKDTVLTLLSHIFSLDIDSSEVDGGRITTWLHGMDHFLENELFGVGFYQCKDYQFVNFQTGFVPPRYHNIYVQYLASAGLYGIVAYFIHRYQTLKLTFKRPTLEKSFVYLSVAALVFTSLFDNHFFNLGPGLNYCIALAFIEGLDKQESKQDVQEA